MSYTYDNLGNITGVYRDGELLSCYEYDEAGQLTRVNDAVQDRTFTYTYDKGGNIRGKSEYVFTLGELNSPVSTIPYGYADANWKDKLTSINGNPITYDQIGNPLTYNGWVYTWEGGRQLKTAANSDVHVFYTYDDDGIRTRKNINGVTTYYTLVENRITAQRTNWKTTYFRYDNDGELISLNWQGAEYFYLRNLQGDVIGLVDENGSLVVEYAYDAWGKPLSITGELAETLGEANPFRYRSYYWDDETGLYYLQSRYYDPEVGRFVNADEQIDHGVLGSNIFTYCENNPVNFHDPDGHIAISIIVARLASVTAFTTIRLSMAMYLYGVTSARLGSSFNFSAWYNPIGILMRNRLSNSKHIKNHIISCIKSKKWKTSKDFNFANKGGNLADFDLSMALGRAKLSFTITKTNNKLLGKTKYVITLKVSDYYDFHKLNKKDAGFVKRSINNYLGYWPQELNFLKKYYWSMTYTHNFYY